MAVQERENVGMRDRKLLPELDLLLNLSECRSMKVFFSVVIVCLMVMKRGRGCVVEDDFDSLTGIECFFGAREEDLSNDTRSTSPEEATKDVRGSTDDG